MTFQVDVKANGMKLDDRLHDYVTGKASKLERYLPGIQEARVELTYSKSARNAFDRNIAQITVRGKNFTLRSEERTDDMFSAFDNAVDKIQRQIERYKGKHYRGPGDRKTIGEVAAQLFRGTRRKAGSESKILRRKQLILTPMDEQEAILQSELLGHDDFFVFFNVNTNAVNVLYRRRDGNYGLIETELG